MGPENFLRLSEKFELHELELNRVDCIIDSYVG